MRGARTVRRGDPGWPGGLDRLGRPPDFLRVRGELPAAAARVVAVVGSRRPDDAGARLARQLGAALARAGAWVVSGGAAGVDGAAHRGALDAGGRTLVVLGGGLDHLYPTSHRPLFARVVEGGGGLAAEVGDGERPARWSFPERNRLVAALAEAVVVVRAGSGSGALITAGWARRLGRPVLAAVPEGPAEVSAGLEALVGLPGCGALPFREAGDVLRLLGLAVRAGPLGSGRSAGVAAREGLQPGVAASDGAEPDAAAPDGPGAALDGSAARLWGVLGASPLHADEAARAAGLGAGPAAAGLLDLEIRGLARRLAGNRYARCDG
jgi:DNA processing protein